MTIDIRKTLDTIYTTESRRILATLIRLLGDFDIAEDAMHDAFAAAAEKWLTDGIPENPRAWLVSTGRFKAIDAMRRRARFVPDEQNVESSAERLSEQLEAHPFDIAAQIDKGIEDDELRLIFTCCHPALPSEARVALTLREVCDLTTEEIAHAFLTTPTTLAQRIVRAKAKIRDARIPYEVPQQSELSERLDAVLQVIYLVFNEGYSASSGSSLTRADLSGEAIRLGRLLLLLLPEPEVTGLLALMLLQESRRTARTSSAGDVILLEDQDRTLWNQELIKEGIALVEQALASRRFGPYTIQAAIAAVHSEAKSASETDWEEIVMLYSLLQRIDPSPVIELNRAVAIAMRDARLPDGQGFQAGLDIIDAILLRGDLVDYRFAHSARGELCRRLGKTDDARKSYERALALTQLEPER
ncbi:MAG: RNA polymerase sigma factor, partial [Bacteroidota bacterium]|nr:RNA polymerase sigma factor [Bacteroidota bacterium]